MTVSRTGAAESRRGAAIVGTGFIAQVHVEALRRLGVHLTGVVGSSFERASTTSQAANLPAPYANFDDMLSDPAVSVVHICAPNRFHFDLAAAALAAGKHVICEKPLAMNTTQTASLAKLARSSGLVNAVCFVNRFYAQAQEARARVAGGHVGDLRLISGSYLQDWLSTEADWNWRLDENEGGSLRAVGDIGSHWLDLIEYITGRRVRAVVADLVTVIPTRYRPEAESATFAPASAIPTGEPIDMRTEDVANLLIQLEGNLSGTLSLSQVSPGRKNHLAFELSGSKSSLRWDSERPEELWTGFRGRPNQVLLRDPALMSGHRAGFPGGHTQGFADAFKSMFAEVYRAIDTPADARQLTFATFDDGHRQAILGEAIAESAIKRKWVQVTNQGDEFAVQAVAG